MQRRIFIGIDLPQEVKKRIVEITKKWEIFPIHWSSEENLHITLSFIGFVGDEEVAAVCEKVLAASKNIEAFDVNLERIVLAPDPEKPKMVWFHGAASEDLKRLHENIEKELGTFARSRKKLNPHVTLGKIQKGKWRELADSPVIDEKFSVSVPVEVVDIFESVTEDGKRKFIKIESCPLA